MRHDFWDRVVRPLDSFIIHEPRHLSSVSRQNTRSGTRLKMKGDLILQRKRKEGSVRRRLDSGIVERGQGMYDDGLMVGILHRKQQIASGQRARAKDSVDVVYWRGMSLYRAGWRPAVKRRHTTLCLARLGSADIQVLESK